MIESVGPLWQALLGTLLTWALTGAGSSLVFFFNGGQRKVLDASLGFAAGVMAAASYWSLLEPAIEMASASGVYGEEGQYSFFPVSVGFIIGAVFVWMADQFLTTMGVSNPVMALTLQTSEKFDKEPCINDVEVEISADTAIENHNGDSASKTRWRGGSSTLRTSTNNDAVPYDSDDGREGGKHVVNWRRILLLIIAITVHNIPEGLAVGVGFGAIGKSSLATFAKARYGQLSGMVEPVAGILGAVAVTLAEPLLPYTLAFAAGAMIYVVFDDIIPEANTSGNGKLASAGAIIGFVIMMSLDVGLG